MNMCIFMMGADTEVDMAHTRHAHILMEPLEYEQLERIARQRRTSVAELIRRAVRESYLQQPSAEGDPVARLAALQLELPRWEELARELDEAYDGGVR